ncbi:MAG: preprotein translocase subunit SecE [Verrucomicrobiota bacterium]
MNKEYIKLLVWAVAVGVAFAFLWRKGYLTRLADYVAETREELRKCTWPTVDELKGSTAVVMVAMALLGGFTVGVDFVLSFLMRLVT